jgi:DNA-binding protein H-NS
MLAAGLSAGFICGIPRRLHFYPNGQSEERQPLTNQDRRVFMPTYKQLTEQLAKVQAQMAAARHKEVAATIAEIKEKIAEYGITPEELGFSSKRSTSRKTGGLPPKYRDPKTGATWSGRGRAPAWLGKRRERFLIQ